MSKFYAFTAGSKVPSWMLKVRYKYNHAYLLNKGLEITFLKSCVVKRDCNGGHLIMPPKEVGCSDVIGIKHANCLHIDFYFTIKRS